MKQNNSPWITQIAHHEPFPVLEGNVSSDITIVGAGIAGTLTAYYLLTKTNKNITLIEGHRIAHGATGHNAGQLVAEFERPLADIVSEFGYEKALQGQAMVEHAWELLTQIMNMTQLPVPIHFFTGRGGYAEYEQLVADLETEVLRHQYGLKHIPVMISDQCDWYDRLDPTYQNLCEVVPHTEINQVLDIAPENTSFFAVHSQKKAVTNSALFTRELINWMIKQYPTRIAIYEYSSVHGIELDAEKPMVITNQGSVTSEKVILCTNGFENFYIHDHNKTSIDTSFHETVHGAVGYMTGFVSEAPLDPAANFYYEPGNLRSNDPFTSDPYFYVTQRPFILHGEQKYLFSVGGPEVRLESREFYHREYDVSREHHDDSLGFVRRYFNHKQITEKFFWHGLMGYTKTGLRVVGAEPRDERLLYNLGCNGVGIMPSIMGAYKISQHINNEPLEGTIFDPMVTV